MTVEAEADQSIEVPVGDFATDESPPKATDDGSSLSDSDSEHERDSFFAFVPQIAKWGCGVVGKEAKLVTKGVVGAPAFTKDFLAGTYSFYRENPKVLYKEVISGFTVAIMQVPESIAFSFVAGVPPLSGLQATWWMAFITGIFGGKPGMISGAAGALAVVVTKLTASDGVLAYLPAEERLNVLYMTMFVCGIFQIGFAVFRLAKLVRLIPETGMIGFMNGEWKSLTCHTVKSTRNINYRSHMLLQFVNTIVIFFVSDSTIFSVAMFRKFRACHYYFHGSASGIPVLYRRGFVH